MFVVLFSEFPVNSSFYLFDRFTFFDQFGDPQGLLLTELSTGAVFVNKTAQERLMFERRFVTIAVTENLV